jgi:CheY-like chemotaxis protein
VVTGSAVRVLLVDDDPRVREILAQQPEGLGYVVSQASDGFAALNKMETGERPDLLVTDYSMPRNKRPNAHRRSEAFTTEFTGTASYWVCRRPD